MGLSDVDLMWSSAVVPAAPQVRSLLGISPRGVPYFMKTAATAIFIPASNFDPSLVRGATEGLWTRS